MALIRVKHLNFEEIFDVYTGSDTLHENEWEDTGRLQESSWQNRYEYEAAVIVEVMEEHDHPMKTVLEVGSGPGILSQKIQEKSNQELTYHLVDKPFAKKYFDENNLKGTFFVKDISIDMDTEGLLPSYDLIVCNDTLEHLLAPTNVIRKFYSLTTDNSLVFISVPNWRMGHQFIYRGLWDYDNFLYLM